MSSLEQQAKSLNKRIGRAIAQAVFGVDGLVSFSLGAFAEVVWDRPASTLLLCRSDWTGAFLIQRSEGRQLTDVDGLVSFMGLSGGGSSSFSARPVRVGQRANHEQASEEPDLPAVGVDGLVSFCKREVVWDRPASTPLCKNRCNRLLLKCFRFCFDAFRDLSVP